MAIDGDGTVIKMKDIIMKATTHPTVTAYPINNKALKIVPNERTLSMEDKLHCLALLQDSLELKTLLTNFASVVAKVIRPFNVHFQSAYGLFSLNNHDKYNFTNSYHLPLSSESPRIGSIIYQSEKPLTTSEHLQFTELHELLIPCLRHSVKLAELNALVFKDHLTNIGNRAYYDECLARAIEQSSRNHQPLSLMVFDIDNFKPINDTLGHLKGDQVLQHFAAVLEKVIRTSDMAFRLGGDEFTLVLQAGDQHSVDKIKMRLLREIDDTPFLSALNFSTSTGYAHWQMGETAAELFAAADKNLYTEKSLKKALKKER